jgi:hypothetical protein
MPRFLTIAPTLLATALVAGEAAPAASPLAEVRIADGKDLMAAWAKTPIARTWTSPAAAPLRDKFTKALAKEMAKTGIDPEAVILALTKMHGRLDSVTKVEGTPVPAIGIRGQADLGPFAEKAMAAIAAADDAWKPITVPGADAAIGPQPNEQARHLQPTMARFGSTLVAAMMVADAKPWNPPAATHALEMRLAARRILDLLPGLMPPEFAEKLEPVLKATDFVKGDVTWTIDLTPEGVLERMRGDYGDPAYQPVDIQVLGKLPASTLLSLAIGLDGKAMWSKYRAAWLADLAEVQGMDRSTPPDEVEAAINASMKSAGVEVTLGQIVQGFTGTTVLAVNAGVPFPTGVLVVPRSEGNDGLIKSALKLYSQFGPMMGVATDELVPPATGSSLSIPLPAGTPVQLTLVADQRSWMLTTDTVLASAWLEVAPGGYLDSPAAKTAMTRAKSLAPEGPVLFATSDTPNVLRNALGFLSMGLGTIDAETLPPAERAAILSSINVLATNCSTGYIVSCQGRQGSDTELRGLLGTVMWIPALAAIALPNLIESRITSNESSARAILEYSFVPAQVQFQAGGYVDQDGDSQGEYGFLDELTGRRAVNDQLPGAHAETSLSLITADHDQGGVVSGYRFAIFLPDGNGGALSEPAGEAKRPGVAAAADGQEKQWVAYAWPETHGDTGRKVFAITNSGKLYTAPAGTVTGVPAWNALFDGKGWDAVPTWPSEGGDDLVPVDVVAPAEVAPMEAPAEMPAATEPAPATVP